MKKIFYTFALILPTLFLAQQTEKENKCDLPKNYQEPKPDRKIQSDF